MSTEPPPRGDPGGGGNASSVPCADGVKLTIATDLGDVAPIELVPAQVAASVISTGQVLAVNGALPGSLLLQGGRGPFTLGTVQVPQAGAVKASFSFSQAEATTAGGERVAVDVCTHPIEFQFERHQVNDQRCEAIVVLDLGRSVVADASGVAFLPQFRVVF